MKLYRDMAVEAIEDAKGAQHLELLGADWYENRTLNLMESIEDERDAAAKVGALLVIVGYLLEKVRSADPSYGLTPVSLYDLANPDRPKDTP